MNRKEKMRLTLGVLLSLSVCAGSADVYAEKTTDDDENTRESSQTYVTRDVEVEGEAARDYFGNEITEQSYYRTGGDVTVIDRKTLDRRHYDQLTDALRQVPDVLIRTPGYRGGEFQNGNTHSVVSINGDDRVVVLVDGRRMDNAAGNVTTWDSVGNTKATVDINQIININGIEKIEVIAGLSAALASRSSEIVDLEPQEAAPSGTAAGYPRVIDTYDSAKRPTRITLQRPPTRVLVHQTNTLETLLALGQGDRIVGVTLDTGGAVYERLREQYPDEIEKIRHAARRELSREHAIAYMPDFFLGWRSTFSPHRYGSTRWWNERGVDTYIVSTSNRVRGRATIEGECGFIDDMGRVFDVQEKSDVLIKEINAMLVYDEGDAAARIPQTVVVVELNGDEIVNYDEGDLVGDMVVRLGGRMPVKSAMIGAEDLLQIDPDVIFVLYFGAYDKAHAERFFRSRRFNFLRAVRGGRVYMLPFACVYTPAVRTVEGLRIIKSGLYPDG
ncbi:TonB-dependent receptor plug domain-containing protein [Selenomonas sp. F0473]|uniref:TonB-dependent receptor plug domain-containing protein n=1 Tax=Selenomonas sp. F0473 TaxID=999423 RepID=UPI0003066392|nr:TonB-dependent receptor plug domain-containing protein [Selenomonas sp. F0473]